MLQNISLKCYSFELSIHKRILKNQFPLKYDTSQFSTLIIRSAKTAY